MLEKVSMGCISIVKSTYQPNYLIKRQLLEFQLKDFSLNFRVSCSKVGLKGVLGKNWIECVSIIKRFAV